MVERRNRFFRSSFMPGRVFASPQDFNEQMAAWLPVAKALVPFSVDFFGVLRGTNDPHY
jgi:hypothetical protein